MNDFMVTFQRILDFKVGNISVGSLIEGCLLLFLFNWFMNKFMGPVVNKILSRFKLEATVQSFVRSLIKVILNFVAICIVSESVGIPIASVLAVIGMLGLAVSLSVQGALSNVANGFMILVNRPFVVDDYISVAGVEGVVKEIDMLCTKILTVDNKLIIVPNSEIMGGKIVNFSSEELRRVDIEVKASCDFPVSEMYKLLLETIGTVPGALDDPAPVVRVNGYTDYSVIYTVRVWTASENYWNCYFDLMEKVGEMKSEKNISNGVPGMRLVR